MASAIQTLEQDQRARQPWPPDDTEESVVGTDFHQMTIMNVRFGINEVAQLLAAPGEPVLWQALSQVTLNGFAHPDGSPYSMMPDVFVYRHPVNQRRGSVAIRLEGPPVLAIEVLSETTYQWDLDMEAGKGYSYAAAGVDEYIMLDPTGLYLPERLRAWRLAEGAYGPWLPGGNGRWHSTVLQLAFGLEEEFAAVYAGDDRRMLREGEVEKERTGLRTALSQLRGALDQARAAMRGAIEQARLERERANAEHERADAEQEEARIERERASAEREEARLERERTDAERQQIRAEMARQAEELQRLRRLLDDQGKGSA